MTIDSKDLLNSILSSLSRIDYIKTEDIPNIDMYMDQVTTFMEQQLNSSRRYPEDKILTKTMINNYTKNNLLPPSDKKKYSKDHILLLTFIYYFKNILSIADIDKLLSPLTEQYFNCSSIDDMTLEKIYNGVFALEQAEVHNLAKDVTRRFHIANEQFADIDGIEGDHLRYFTFICMLSFDVYIKKMLIEKLIDLMPDSRDVKSKKKK